MGSHDAFLPSPWCLWRDTRTVRLWAERITTYPLQPNASGEPRLKAGAQRTLEGVGCSAWCGGVRPVLCFLLHVP